MSHRAETDSAGESRGGRSERRGTQQGRGGGGSGQLGEEGRGEARRRRRPLLLECSLLPSLPGLAPERNLPRPGCFRGRRQLVAAPCPRPSSNCDPEGGADAAQACAEVRGPEDVGSQEGTSGSKREALRTLSGCPLLPAPLVRVSEPGNSWRAAPRVTPPPGPRS